MGKKRRKLDIDHLGIDLHPICMLGEIEPKYFIRMNLFYIYFITYSIFISLLEADPLDTIDHTEIASSGTQKGNMATIFGIENRFLVSAKLWKEVQNISLSHLF